MYERMRIFAYRQNKELCRETVLRLEHVSRDRKLFRQRVVYRLTAGDRHFIDAI